MAVGFFVDIFRRINASLNGFNVNYKQVLIRTIHLHKHSYTAVNVGVLVAKGSALLLSIFFTLGINNFAVAQQGAMTVSASEHDVKLQHDYQLITSVTYRELVQNSNAFPAPSSSLTKLVDEINIIEKNNQPTQAVGLILANINFIKSNTDADALQLMTRVLLANHAELIARDLLQIATASGDDYLLGRITFELAKYYAEQHSWQQARNELKKIDIATVLPKKDADEAFIILGAALQQEKKHRESLSYYSKIKPDSTQYRIAQLNTAIAYIRQDWWTDAKLAIDNALLADTKDSDGLTNRLHTVLGFSQLQNGFYRNARETFRKVHIKSEYSNRALLGLGMSALHQEDFIGALNAFNHLKKKDPNDISVMESYLLSAFTLEKLKQPKTASATYSEAIYFYEQKNIYYSTLLNRLATQRKSGAVENSLIEAINADLQIIEPALITLSDKIRILHQLLNYQPSINQQTAIRQLNARMHDAYVELAAAAINKKQEILNSYLSQSRFGLAKLYDSP